MGRRILVIAAHPDDELLGCGGTIALHTKAGDEVTVVIVCEGESLRYGEGGAGQKESMEAAAEKLGVKDIRLVGLADQRLDTLTLTEIISPLEQALGEVEPHIVYCQFGGDANRDHRILFEAVLVATRPVEKSIEAIYAFYTVSSTEWGYPRSFIPDTWIDISQTLEDKISAFRCYKSEVRSFPHPRSPESLRYHALAYGSQCCMQAAEVFMTVRRLYRNGKTPS